MLAYIDRPGLEIVHQTALVHTATTLMEVGKETQGDFLYFLFIQGLLISFYEYVLAKSRIGATGVAVSV